MFEMEKQRYLDAKFKLYLIESRWLNGVELDEYDFNEFYQARQVTNYYEGARRARQQRGAIATLEGKASKDVDIFVR